MEWDEIEDKFNEKYWIIKKNKFWQIIGGFIAFLVAIGVIGWKTVQNAISNPEIYEITQTAKIHKKELDSIVENAKKESAYYKIPIGTILAWHGNLKDANDNEVNFDLPIGWIECNGQTIVDKESSLNGVKIPNLNDGSFLKGNKTSGIEQEQNWRRLTILSAENIPYKHEQQTIPVDNWTERAVYGGGWGVGKSTNGLKFKYEAGEIRPKNVSVVWIIKVK